MLNNSKRLVHARPPFHGRKDSNPEDLSLFKELHKRDKFDGMASLLQPVSDEFEPSASGNPSLYKIASGKKGFGYDFFGETGKNDYDWLKTPPATPLFTSIEMEGNAPELVVQREIPIIHPLSRFAGNNSETMKGNNNERTKTPIPKQKIPVRSVTPNQQRPINSFPSTEPKTTTSKPLLGHSSIDHQTKNKNLMTQAVAKQKIIATTEYLNPNAINKRTNQSIIGSTKSTNQCPKDDQFLFSNISRNTADSKIKQRNRSNVSPFASRPAFEGFSNEAPPNLRTSERSTSATRRSTTSNQKMTAAQKPEAKPIIRRQSCSPSVTRGRNIMESNSNNKFEEEIADGKVLRCNKKGHVLGSRMVDKVMNARKLSSSYGNYVQERDQTKPKYVQK